VFQVENSINVPALPRQYREFVGKFMCTQLFSVFLDHYTVELAQEQELTSHMVDQVSEKIQKLEGKREEIRLKIQALQHELEEYDEQIGALKETQKALSTPVKKQQSNNGNSSNNNNNNSAKKKTRLFSSSSLNSILNTKKDWL
jgi:hypothetical protein